MRATLRWLRNEPMVYFVLLGGAIFVAYQQWHGGEPQSPGRIVVTPGRIEALANGFTLTWKRTPSASELDDLIQGYVREEIYVREAIALGLEQDDSIVRRRLQQKLEFVSEDLIARAEPSEEQLRAWFEAHPERFRAPLAVTFTHVYLNAQRRGGALAADAAALREQLRRTGEQTDATSLGDPFLLETAFDALPVSEVRQLFGDGFASALAELPTGEWHGPIESAYGVHLVLIRARSGGQPLAFDDTREVVRSEWLNEQRVEGNAQFYDGLRKRYQVSIQKPAAELSAKAEVRQ